MLNADKSKWLRQISTQKTLKAQELDHCSRVLRPREVEIHWIPTINTPAWASWLTAKIHLAWQEKNSNSSIRKMKHYREKHCKRLVHKLWVEDLHQLKPHGELTKFQSLRKSNSKKAMVISTPWRAEKSQSLTTTSCTRHLVLMVESKMEDLISSLSLRKMQPSRKTRRSSLRAKSPTQSLCTMQTLLNSSQQMTRRR